MIAPAYISTLGSSIEAKEPERVLLEQRTQEFLNQGGKIIQLGTVVLTDTPLPTLSSHNKRVSSQNKKRRDSLVEDIITCLEQGMAPADIQSKLKITHWTYSKTVKENNLEEFAKN